MYAKIAYSDKEGRHQISLCILAVRAEMHDRRRRWSIPTVLSRSGDMLARHACEADKAGFAVERQILFTAARAVWDCANRA